MARRRLVEPLEGEGAAFGPPFCFLSEGPITELSSVAVEMGSFYQHQSGRDSLSGGHPGARR
jgi:hypothetical protein